MFPRDEDDIATEQDWPELGSLPPVQRRQFEARVDPPALDEPVATRAFDADHDTPFVPLRVPPTLDAPPPRDRAIQRAAVAGALFALAVFAALLVAGLTAWGA